jgi:pimeloyl-ACP methyl ester carboxylesterase
MEHTGVVKSIKVELTKYYSTLVNESRGKKDDEFHWWCGHNEEFDLSIYIPLEVMNHPNRKLSNVLVMVNGLNETHHIHYSHYDRIGAYLAPRGICGILYPAPFHLNRTAYTLSSFEAEYMDHSRQHFETFKEPLQRNWDTGVGAGAPTVIRVPHYSLLRHPEAMYHCFDQIAKELISLARFLRGNDKKGFGEDDKTFYDQFFKRGRSLKVSLLGYSLGGLAALYAFLQKPNLFERCVLVNSGSSICELTPQQVGIAEEQWQEVVKNVKNIQAGTLRHHHSRLLEDIILNSAFRYSETQEALSANVHKMLCIAGGADVVARSQHLGRFTPDQKGMSDGQVPSARPSGPHILQIAGLEHPLLNSPVYDHWFPTIMDHIVTFLRSPRLEEKVVSREEMMDVLSNIELKGEPWDGAIGEFDLLDPQDLNLRVDRLLPLLPDLKRDEFVTYYMISKRYFTDDAELMRNLRRQREKKSKSIPR